jgi:hypothetical protein
MGFIAMVAFWAKKIDAKTDKTQDNLSKFETYVATNHPTHDGINKRFDKVDDNINRLTDKIEAKFDTVINKIDLAAKETKGK